MIIFFSAMQSSCYRIYLLILALLSYTTAYASEEVQAPVSVSEVSIQPIYQSLTVTGSVTSPQVARLSVATSGLIQRIDFEAGDIVSLDKTLLLLDDELARHTYKASEALVSQTQLAVDDAQRRLREARQLKSQQGIAETVVRDLISEVAQDTAALAKAQADALREKAILERHHLKAPFAGVISQKQVEIGEWVTPGQSVFELVAAEQLRLDFSVSEDYLAKLSTSTLVTFFLNALPETQFMGSVLKIVPITNTKDRTFLLRIASIEAQDAMQPGMSATAHITIPMDRKGLVVPRDALLQYPDGRKVVWTVDASEKKLIAKENLVSLGVTHNGQAEILSGLNANDKVIIRGNENLRNGQIIKLVD